MGPQEALLVECFFPIRIRFLKASIHMEEKKIFMYNFLQVRVNLYIVYSNVTQRDRNL